VSSRGSRETHEQRASTASRIARRLPEAAVAGLAVVVCVTGIAFALGGPKLDLGLTHADGLAWIPAGLRGDVESLRDQLVTTELHALTHCLDAHQPARWTSSYTLANPIDQPDVARLTADPARASDPATLTTAALATENILAPWVERIEIAVGHHVVLTLNREGLHPDEPLTEPRELLRHSPGAPPWLTTTVPNADTDLACSAPTPL
jgi:hypothetical protein